MGFPATSFEQQLDRYAVMEYFYTANIDLDRYDGIGDMMGVKLYGMKYCFQGEGMVSTASSTGKATGNGALRNRESYLFKHSPRQMAGGTFSLTRLANGVFSTR